MITHDRHQHLLRQLERTGSLQIAGLHETLGVTPMTIWRDLRLLEQSGMLKRVRGGAVRIDRSAEPEFRLKEQRSADEKRRIAHYAAARYVTTGDTIIVEGGTTVAEILNHLTVPKLTLMTNSLPILSRAYTLGRNWQLQASGGVLSPVSGNFVGPEAIAYFSGKRAQTFFMSATGLDPVTGALTDPNPVEIEVKRAMAASAKRVVLLLDSSKIGEHSIERVLPLRKLHVLITDRGAPRAVIQKLRKLGLNIEQC